MASIQPVADKDVAKRREEAIAAWKRRVDSLTRAATGGRSQTASVMKVKKKK